MCEITSIPVGRVMRDMPTISRVITMKAFFSSLQNDTIYSVKYAHIVYNFAYATIDYQNHNGAIRKNYKANFCL